MGALRSDRVWLFGGLALIAVLIAAGWFLMIGPKYTEASDVRAQAEDSSTQLSTLRTQLSQLKADSANLPDYSALLTTYKNALPTDDDIPTFLRQLQTMGTKLNLGVTAYTATGRDESKAVSTVRELPITLSAYGRIEDISKFIKQLQTTQPRAVLIESVDLKADIKADGTIPTNATLTLTLNAFRLKSSASTTTVTTQ
jgi:Tfp pilus assembly protein PilO